MNSDYIPSITHSHCLTVKLNLLSLQFSNGRSSFLTFSWTENDMAAWWERKRRSDPFTGQQGAWWCYCKLTGLSWHVEHLTVCARSERRNLMWLHCLTAVCVKLKSYLSLVQRVCETVQVVCFRVFVRLCRSQSTSERFTNKRVFPWLWCN